VCTVPRRAVVGKRVCGESVTSYHRPVGRRTEAIRKALEERKHRLAFQVVRPGRHERLRRFLERDVWPRVPPGMEPMSKDERERILGYGPEGH
jgi:hypothetical protein